jgi:hypothetical protein
MKMDDGLRTFGTWGSKEPESRAKAGARMDLLWKHDCPAGKSVMK